MSDEDQSKFKIHVSTSFSKDGGEIHVITDFAGVVSQQIMFLQEKAVRDALIKLGWTPPAENKPQARGEPDPGCLFCGGTGAYMIGDPTIGAEEYVKCKCVE